jgi:pimeloyl-ACP methyl ester carboxylesterase
MRTRGSARCGRTARSSAAASERAVLFGYSEGAPMSILFAAAHPEQVSGLIRAVRRQR